MPGQKGNKGGGRKPLSVEMTFFRLLDKALPKAISYCDGLIDEAKKHKEEPIALRKPYDDLAVQATKVLMSRAPERIKHSGDEDSPIRLSLDI